jgi:hypothetical protein
MQRVADWLNALGLGQYAQRFAENDVDASVLRDLTDQDLEKIGVSLARISHTTLAQFPDFVVPVGDFSGLRALAWRRLPQSSWTSSW